MITTVKIKFSHSTFQSLFFFSILCHEVVVHQDLRLNNTLQTSTKWPLPTGDHCYAGQTSGFSKNSGAVRQSEVLSG